MVRAECMYRNAREVLKEVRYAPRIALLYGISRNEDAVHAASATRLRALEKACNVPLPRIDFHSGNLLRDWK